VISRRLLAAAMGVVLLLGTTPTFAATEVSVNIVDTPRPQLKWGYAPATRKLDPGTWVTWSNNGEDPHTVTAVDGSFDSGNLDPSEGFSWFFDQPGTFQYICALHPWMTGKIIVGDGVGLPPADQVAPPTDSPTSG
jgi:plastocyanin